MGEIQDDHKHKGTIANSRVPPDTVLQGRESNTLRAVLRDRGTQADPRQLEGRTEHDFRPREQNLRPESPAQRTRKIQGSASGMVIT